jgi:flagellar biosynthesis protein FlhF
MGRSAQVRYHNFFCPLKPSRLILTRLDEAAGMGVVLNAVTQLGLALSYTTDGPHVPQDIQEGCTTRIAELLCPTMS